MTELLFIANRNNYKKPLIFLLIVLPTVRCFLLLITFAGKKQVEKHHAFEQVVKIYDNYQF